MQHPPLDTKGKGRALVAAPNEPVAQDYQHWHPVADPEQRTISEWWMKSRERAKADKKSWDYSRSCDLLYRDLGSRTRTHP